MDNLESTEDWWKTWLKKAGCLDCHWAVWNEARQLNCGHELGPKIYGSGECWHVLQNKINYHGGKALNG